MVDRYPLRPRKQSSWFVPVLVVIGIGAFFVWESGWRPFNLSDAPTGKLLDDVGTSTATAKVTPSESAGSTLFADGQAEPDMRSISNDEMLLEFDTHRAANAMASTPGPSKRDAGVTQASFEPDRVATPTRTVAQERLLAGLSPDVREQVSPAVRQDPKPSPELAGKMERINKLIKEGDYLTAHRDLSTIYWYEPEQRELIRETIEQTSASIYAAPQPHYVKPYVVQDGDTLGAIAEKYKVPFKYLARLNRIQPNRVRIGTRLKVIRGPFAAVVDLSEFRLTIHAHGYYVRHYPIGIGKQRSTPTGEFSVENKLNNPTYYDPQGPTVAADDPANPLGEYWLGLGNSYGIHGTIDPDSIGRAESRGCIRLRDNDAGEVFDLLSVGSKVLIRK